VRKTACFAQDPDYHIELDVGGLPKTLNTMKKTFFGGLHSTIFSESVVEMVSAHRSCFSLFLIGEA
jgi:hypothetical protein